MGIGTHQLTQFFSHSIMRNINRRKEAAAEITAHRGCPVAFLFYRNHHKITSVIPQPWMASFLDSFSYVQVWVKCGNITHCHCLITIQHRSVTALGINFYGFNIRCNKSCPFVFRRSDHITYSFLIIVKTRISFCKFFFPFAL